MRPVQLHPDLQGHTKAINQSKAERMATDNDLIAMAQAGDRKAQGEMVKRYSRFVIKVASQYAKRKNIDMEDLVLVGQAGILAAVKGCDVSRGNAFSTYAVWQIRAHIQHWIWETENTIRVPANIWMEANMVVPRGDERAKAKREEARDLIASLGCHSMSKTIDRSEIKPEYGGDNRQVEYNNHKSQARTDEATETRMLHQDIERHLAELKPKFAQVIRLRFGLDGGEVQTLRYIAEKMCISPERVRQMEAKAKGVLRAKMANLARNEQD